MRSGSKNAVPLWEEVLSQVASGWLGEPLPISQERG